MTWLAFIGTCVVASSATLAISIYLLRRVCKDPRVRDLVLGPSPKTLGTLGIVGGGSMYMHSQSAKEWTQEGQEENKDMGFGLTCILAEMFPYSAKAIEAMVMEMVPPMLEKYKPKWMEGIEITKFNLGTEPPVITKMRVDTQKGRGKEDAIRILVNMKWVSNTDIQLYIKPLPTKLKFVPGFVERGLKNIVNMHAGVRQIKFDATLQITLSPLRKRLPVTGAMQVCMLHPPYMDFAMSLSKDSQESSLLAMVKPWLIETIRGYGFGFVTLPEHMHIPVELGAPDPYRPHGVLKVCIYSAGKVPSMDLVSKSDTYAKFWVRPRVTQRTKTVWNEYYPAWDHDAFMLVHDKKHQFLYIELWDDDTDDALAGGDDFVGSVYVKLSDIPDDGSKTEFHIPVCAEKADTTKDPATVPVIPGDKDEGGVCRLRFMMQWVNPSDFSAFPELGQPGCLQVLVKQIKVRTEAADRIFPVSLVTDFMGKTYESLVKFRAPKPLLGAPHEEYATAICAYVAPFDVLGSTHDKLQAEGKVQLQIKGGKHAELVTKFEIPVSEVFAKTHADIDNMYGGAFTLAAGDVVAELDVWWHGVLAP